MDERRAVLELINEMEGLAGKILTTLGLLLDGEEFSRDQARKMYGVCIAEDYAKQMDRTLKAFKLPPANDD